VAESPITAAELARMSPQERADAVNKSVVRDLREVSDEFRSEIRETSLRLGAQRRARA